MSNCMTTNWQRGRNGQIPGDKFLCQEKNICTNQLLQTVTITDSNIANIYKRYLKRT